MWAHRRVVLSPAIVSASEAPTAASCPAAVPPAVVETFVRLYEEGLRLYERCAKKLDAAELRITQLAEALQKQAGAKAR